MLIKHICVGTPSHLILPFAELSKYVVENEALLVVSVPAMLMSNQELVTFSVRLDKLVIWPLTWYSAEGWHEPEVILANVVAAHCVPE